MRDVHDEEESVGLLPIPGISRSSSSTDRPRKPLRKWLIALRKWIDGPEPPKRFQIKPFLAASQRLPLRVLEKLLPTRGAKLFYLFSFLCCWVAMFSLVLYSSTIKGPNIGRFGSPTRLSCTTSLWPNSIDCGLEGGNCQPFEDDSFAFLCPAACQGTQVLEPVAVGDQEVNYRQMVIGGFSSVRNYSIYRGDAWICQAAIHAGIISQSKGGSGFVHRQGEQSDFPGIESNGILSMSFPSYFPLSFNLTALADGGSSNENNDAVDTGSTSLSYEDMRWKLLAISVVFSCLLSISTASPSAFFFPIFTGLFFHVALVSDPPPFSGYDDLFSLALKRFLPSAFIAVVLYRYCIRRTLNGVEAQFEKTILWLGGAWVGALHNYTFDRLPLSRLTPHDIKQQPGAITVLIIIIFTILAIAVGQAWCLRQEGRLRAYLKLYALMVISVLVLLTIPSMNLRLHHYILALVLLPGTAIQTRPSLLYQGILAGLLINGIARWGFASVLETSAALLEGAQIGSKLPSISSPTIIGSDNITFTLPNSYEGFDGIAVLVNDVLRFRSFDSDYPHNVTWERHQEGKPEFVRFRYVSRIHPRGFRYGDFTKAGIWMEDGSWKPIKSEAN